MEPLKILYGVNGEGLGHATRSEVVIRSLLARHDVRVVASGAASGSSGRACRAWTRSSARASPWRTARSGAGRPSGHNAGRAPRALPGTVRRGCVVHHWRPDVVVTDFEPLAGLYARSAHVPLVCVDNIHMLDRCRHDEAIVGAEHPDPSGERRDPGDGADRRPTT